MHPNAILDLLLALALGLLVGLQREWSKSEIAGVRTFPLIAILGTLNGMLSDQIGGWTVGAALIAVAAMLVVRNLARLRAGSTDRGLTTERYDPSEVMFSQSCTHPTSDRFSTAVIPRENR